MRLRDIALAVGVMVIWGCNFVVVKFGLEDFPPLLLTGLRFCLVALTLIWFVPRPDGRTMRQLAVLSVTLGSLHFSLMFLGLTRIDASVASIAVQLQVPFAALLAAVVFKDYLGWRRALGMALAFVGVVIVAGAPTVVPELGFLLLIVGASLVWSVANIQVKALPAVGVFTMNAWISAMSGPQLIVLSLIFEDDQLDAIANAGVAGWGAVLYMAVLVTVVGYGYWYKLIERYSTNQTMPFTMLVPVSGIISGVLLRGEPFGWELAVGALCTMAGVGVIVLRRPKLRDPRSGME